ncbi:MAG: bifunctional oligoribonuclease/PAP phosphatase NrnA [Deltaproteobacteria bacterium]|jgi:phosphoesterase RecJ-like protein|nr:bifunctional oligoribonuclease/PAP phosphatase NrnA [Deltaproteobacteria bacterium]
MMNRRKTDKRVPLPSKAFMGFLLEADGVMILGHQHPDGDALGSAAGLAAMLRDLGKRAVVGVSGRIPPNISFLMDPPKYFMDVPCPAPKYFEGYGLLVYVDCHGPSRVWPEAVGWDGLPPNLVIDHHVHDEELRGALAVFHDRHASSTGELIARLARVMGVTLPRASISPLLAAIATDTGFFSQENATSESLREAAELVAQGGKLALLHEKLSCGYSLQRMRLLKNSLSSLRLYLGGKVAVMLLTPGMLVEAEAKLEDADGFIEYPRALGGVLLAAFIKDDLQGGMKVSLRSRPPISAMELAKGFGGGGHELAAAYTDRIGSPELARDRFLEAAARVFLGEGPEGPF